MQITFVIRTEVPDSNAAKGIVASIVARLTTIPDLKFQATLNETLETAVAPPP
ncbi:hypothetical protein LCGC14_2747110 [marine sediment metagenome]|uniref:Uncharacterized protein n=1 Tax=marine sediment metagenome TaxID=412755 RepID=A0A0F8XGH0_9ZZZZ